MKSILKQFENRKALELGGIALVILLLLILLPKPGYGQGNKCSCASPEPPSGLKAEAGVDNIELSWYPSPSAGVKGYLVYRGVNRDALDTFDLAYPSPMQRDRFIDRLIYPEGTDPDGNYYYYVKTVNVNDQQSAASNLANAQFTPPDEPPDPVEKGGLRLFVPDSGAPNGELITVPIKIGNADGLTIYSMDSWVTYNPDIIVAAGITRTELLQAYTFASNLNKADEGVVAAIVTPPLTATSPITLYGEAALMDVTFLVAGTAGQTSTMSTPYTFTVGVDIYGTTIYTDLNAAAQASAIPIFHQSGVFTVTAAGADAPSYLQGDVEPLELGDKDVDSNDVNEVLKLAVAEHKANNRQRQVGDINGDERINSADAALIQRLAAGKPRLLTPRERQALRARRANVSGDASVSVETIFAMRGQNISLPVKFSNSSGVPIAGVDLQLNYDQSILTLSGATAADAASDFKLEYTPNATRSVKIALVPKQEGNLITAESGTLLNLNFTVKSTATLGNWPVSLALTRLSDQVGQDFASSNLQVPVSTQSGFVKLSGAYLPIILKN